MSIPAGLQIGDRALVSLSAVATSLGEQVGTEGALVEGGGDNGEDLVAGRNGGQDTAEVVLEVADNAGLELVKSIQSIADPNGGERPVPGAVITYQIDLVFVGEGELTDLIVVDEIPEHTEYVANSMRLNDVPQSDINDFDVAFYDELNRKVQFEFGDLTVPRANHTVQFSVEIE